jgi:type IV pilus assembly protein PilA
MSLTLKTKSANSQKGFTLLEILLVVAIISILAGIVILAINPTKQLGDTRNAQRRSDVLTILNGVYQFALDNDGDIPTIPAISTSCVADADAEICQNDSTDCEGGSNVDLYTDLVAGGADGTGSNYLVSIPRDPEVASSTSDGTGYSIVQLLNGRVTVCALAPDNNAEISVTR